MAEYSSLDDATLRTLLNYRGLAAGKLTRDAAIAALVRDDERSGAVGGMDLTDFILMGKLRFVRADAAEAKADAGKAGAKASAKAGDKAAKGGKGGAKAGDKSAGKAAGKPKAAKAGGKGAAKAAKGGAPKARQAVRALPETRLPIPA